MKKEACTRSKQELIEAIQKEWQKITIETCHRLILSIPNRVKAVIKAKGGHTKYYFFRDNIFHIITLYFIF